MAEMLLFDSAQGQSVGFHSFADELRAAGHTVHLPDLFNGRMFATIDEGMGYAEELGFPDEIISRGERAVEALPNELVYAGFSLGVLPAQKLAQTRAGARGGLSSTRAFRPAPSEAGRQACRCRSMAWTTTRSSSARATSTRPARSSTRPTTPNSSSIRATSISSPTRAYPRTTLTPQRC
jgi:hypothetical protein